MFEKMHLDDDDECLAPVAPGWKTHLCCRTFLMLHSSLAWNCHLLHVVAVFLFTYLWWGLRYCRIQLLASWLGSPIGCSGSFLCLCFFLGRSYTVCGTKHLNIVPPGSPHMLASFASYVLFPGTTKIILAYSMDNPTIIHGLSIDTPWIIHG